MNDFIKLVISICLCTFTISCAQQKQTINSDKQHYTASCKTTFDYIYDLHVSAINSAQSGLCEQSITQFESTIREWKKLSTNKSCTEYYQKLAQDGVHRAKHDLTVAKSKYCKMPN